MSLTSIKALACDVFGTVVGTHDNLVRDLESCGASQGIMLDWERVVERWRRARRLSISAIQGGEMPWAPLHLIHRQTLAEILAQFNVMTLSAADLDHWSQAWHRLTPWPDVVAGLTRLRRRFIVASLSDGNIALLVNMAKHGALPWDCVLSAELARQYKPAPEVYLTAVGLLGLKPSEVLMVAAHDWDLEGAQAAGLRTAFIQRSLDTISVGTSSHATWDMEANDFNDLADQLECA